MLYNYLFNYKFQRRLVLSKCGQRKVCCRVFACTCCKNPSCIVLCACKKLWMSSTLSQLMLRHYRMTMAYAFTTIQLMLCNPFFWDICKFKHSKICWGNLKLFMQICSVLSFWYYNTVFRYRDIERWLRVFSSNDLKMIFF